MNKKTNEKVAEAKTAETTAKSPKKKLKLSTIIGIVVACVVALAGAITAVVLLRPNDLASAQIIHFNANGGTGTIASVTKQSNTSLELPDSSAITRTGYDFVGWATSETATQAEILDTPEELLLDGSTETTLYAVWDLVEYTITFSGSYNQINGNATENNTYSMTYTIEDELVLPTAARTYYDFTGWKVNFENGTNTNWTKDTIYNPAEFTLGTGFYGDISLDLQTVGSEFRIFFLSDNRDSLFVGTTYEYLIKPADESEYVYIRYNDPFWAAYQKDNSEDGKNYLFISEENFQIPENHDMTITPTSFVYPYDSNITGLKSSKTWKGAISNVNSGASNLTTNYMNAEKTAFALTAQWTTVKINLKIVNPETGKMDTSTKDYNSNYGISGSTEIAYYSNITLPTPTLEGYTFLGWYEGTVSNLVVTYGELFAKPNQTILMDLTKNITIYAKWEKIS